MYIERDAKILLLYYSLMGIITFIVIYFIFLRLNMTYPNENFSFVQIMIFGVASVLSIIVVGSLYSLKKEISRQQEYLRTKQKTKSSPSTIYVPYNKSGLYSLILISMLGIIVTVYLFIAMVFQPLSNPDISFQRGTLETVSLILFLTIMILIVILVITVRTLMRRIETPLYYEYKSCPRCNSSDISKVEYSWWGGLLGPYLVHEVRCKKCGTSYDGSSGRNIKKPIALYFALGLILAIIIVIMEYFFT